MRRRKTWQAKKNKIAVDRLPFLPSSLTPAADFYTVISLKLLLKYAKDPEF